VRPVLLGVLGARSFIATRAVIPAIRASAEADLVAVASRGGPVPDALRALDAGSYEAVIDHPAVEAVYVPLPNGLHREWVERAAAAGKPVLCEKPLAPCARDAEAMFAAAGRAGVLLAEAWMTPFQPRWRRALDMAAGGALGELRHVRAEFTFTVGPERAADYRWDPGQGGGALLDVGIYCLGPAVELWGSEPVEVSVGRRRAATGVDATSAVQASWGDGRAASVLVSFELPERQLLEIVGTAGRLAIVDRAHTGGQGATAAELVLPDGTRRTLESPDDDPYERMVSAFARAVRGVEPWPRPAGEVVGLLLLLDRIAAARG
jgi:predicted dehydrogenase